MVNLLQLYQDFSVVVAAYLPAIQWAVDHAPYRYHAFCRVDDRLCRARDAGDEEAFAQHVNTVKAILREARKEMKR